MDLNKKEPKEKKQKKEPEVKPAPVSASPEPVKKNKGPLIIKIVSGLVALSCVAFACYSLVLLILDNTVTPVTNTYLTIGNKSIDESRKIYSDRSNFGTDNQDKLEDYAFVGTKLFLSESKLTPNLLNPENQEAIFGKNHSDFYLYDLTNNSAKSESNCTHSDKDIYYIETNNLSVGDYLIYSDPDNGGQSYCNPYSIHAQSNISLSIYTLPNQEGARRKITLKNNPLSPYTLLTVENVGSTLVNYYDAVIFDSEHTLSDLSTLTVSEETKDEHGKIVTEAFDNTNYQVRFVSSLQEAINTKATLSFAIGDSENTYDSVFTHHDSSFQTSLLSNSSLDGYDALPEIRETTGYLDQAGQGYYNIIGNNYYASNTRIGKESFVVDDDGFASTITSILTKSI